jgi:peptidoglycan hydrolase-like protein with peptidoglycan-binding domain
MSRRERRLAREQAPRRGRRRLLTALAIVAVVGLVGGTGWAVVAYWPSSDDAVAVDAPSSTSRSSTTTTTTVPPSTTTTIPAMAQPAPVTLPPVPGGSVSQGSTGAEVAAYQERLAALRFDPGTQRGTFTTDTTYAVHALQKLMGVPVSGRLGEAERAALQTFQYPAPYHPTAEPDRTEVDVTKQVMTFYEGHQVRLITTISTGSGERYCYTPFSSTTRVCENAMTPPGRYAYTYYVDAWHRSPLGQLYKPFYFNRGIAVHGYPSVPVRPASHGCVRVPMRVADYWETLVDQGDPVYVDGTQAATVQAPNVVNPNQPALPGTRTVGGPPRSASGTPNATAPPSLGPVDPTPTTVAPTTTTLAPTTTTAPPATTTTTPVG